MLDKIRQLERLLDPSENDYLSALRERIHPIKGKASLGEYSWSSYGYGDAYTYASEYGNGSGNGSGSGYGNVYGNGNGYAYEYGYGSGNGNGYGEDGNLSGDGE